MNFDDGAAASPCALCRDPSRLASVSWKRQHPEPFHLNVCQDCSDRLHVTSDGLAKTPAQYMELIEMYSSLAGEVWDNADTSYWFRFPMASAATATVEETPLAARSIPIEEHLAARRAPISPV